MNSRMRNEKKNERKANKYEINEQVNYELLLYISPKNFQKNGEFSKFKELRLLSKLNF